MSIAPAHLKSNLLFIVILLVLGLFACDDDVNLPMSKSPFYEQPNAKLWKHRVNCEQEADSMAHLFPGIEIDIHYVDSSASFICTHGEPCAGGSLEDLISSIDLEKRPYLWLDFKNSDDSAVLARSITTLKQKLIDLKILDKTIVETRNPDCIDSLTKYNIYSSYWVPHDYDTNPSYTYEQMISVISNTITQHKPTVLSANYTMFSFLKTNFPNQSLHFWTNGLSTEEHKSIINELRAYQNTKVILIDYAAPF